MNPTAEATLRVHLEGAVAHLTALSGGAVLQAAEHALANPGDVPDVLKRPAFIGLEQEGIHKVTYEFIMKCDVRIRSMLWGNVVLTGDLPDLPTVAARLRDELAALAPAGTDVRVRVGS